MTTLKKIWCALLLVSLFALAGCPEVAQQGSAGAQSGERSGGGD